MEQPTGGDVVVAGLASAGVEVVFGIPSVHNLPVYEALRRHGGIRAVTVRHEQAAAGAADAYARVTGRLGVCITSTGPGAANAMGGLLEAFVSGSPVLHLTGQVDSRFLDQGRGFIHEVPDQPAMLGSVSKATFRAASQDDIAATLAESIRKALTHRRGPVSLEVPIDFQYATCSAPPAPITVTVPEPPFTAEHAMGEALQILAGAERPLIWAGGGVVASGAEAELQAVARLLGAGVITSPNGRGVLPEDDPLSIGNLAWDESVRQLCQDADVLLAVGTRFQGPNTQNWQMPLPPTLVHVDVDPSVPGRCYPATVAVVGDARRVLQLVLDGLDHIGEPPGRAEATAPWRARVAEAAAQARASLRDTLGAQVGLLDALAARLSPATVVVKDSTIPAYTWGNRLLPVAGSRRSVMPNGFAIGLGMPHAIGAAAAAGAQGEAVVLLVGDGGFMLAPGELATLAQERLGVVVLLFDDGGYGILRNIQDRQFQGRIGVDLGSPDFCGLARSLGVAAERVSSVDAYGRSVGAALEAAVAGVPTLIEVDLAAIGPMAVPYIGTSRPPARVATGRHQPGRHQAEGPVSPGGGSPGRR